MPKPKNHMAGKHVGGTTKATKLPRTGKKKQQPRASGSGGEHGGGGGGGSGEHGGGGGGGKKKSRRSFLGLLASGLGFVGLFAWQVWTQLEQRRADKDVLQAMLLRPLAITQHAACRMDCRFIQRPEVEETLRSGRINARKSEPALRPCPKYVVDAEVGPQQKAVQGVFAACKHETRVITVIDKATDWPCGPC